MKGSSQEHSSFWLHGLMLVLSPLALMPLAVARRIGALFGLLVFYSIASLRRKVLANIVPSLPFFGQLNQGGGTASADVVARRFFANFGRFLAEAVRFHFGLGRKMLEDVEFRGIEHYLQASRQGRGVIFVTAHCGNWEAAALAFGLRFAPMTIVVRHQRSQSLTELLSRLRGQYGNETILKDGAARKVFNTIKRGGVVAILADIAVPQREGVLTEFLGRPAWTTPMPAVIAQKTGCALLPGFIHREGERLVVEFHPPVEAEGQDTASITQQLSRHIEEHISRYPDEWFWLYHRWKGAPASSPAD